jgi:hypothetical protein
VLQWFSAIGTGASFPVLYRLFECEVCGLLIAELRQVRECLTAAVASLGDGVTLRGGDALVLLGELVAIQRAAAAGRLVVQRRAVSSNAWSADGAPSPQVWLAGVTGETLASAARSLVAGEQLAGLEETSRQLAQGSLSEAQAALVASGASADPAAEDRLLKTARRRGLGELGREARAVRHAARGSREPDRERIHRSRYLRTWTSEDGAFEGRFRITPDHGAILQGALDAGYKDVFEQAREDGREDPAEAYQADALVDLARAFGAGPTSEGGPRAVLHIRVDHSVLSRGYTQAGEVCEIHGGGPISAETARSFAEDAILRALLVDADGQVVAVRHAGRTITAETRRRLIERDPVCVVPGCGRRRHLEIHHLTPYSLGGQTSIDNLARVCSHHHDQITHQGAKLEGQHPQWTWTSPPRAAPD